MSELATQVALSVAVWAVSVFLTVSKLSVRDDSLDVQIDVATLQCVRKETEPKSIRTALCNSVREVSLLSFDRLLHFCLIEVAVAQSLVELLQRDAVHHVDRINDVAQTLGPGHKTRPEGSTKLRGMEVRVARVTAAVVDTVR